ncbi:hypothetical protein M5689_022820 [Euphorbia peplus]|nr:hypothetical protein M5689_022820 [Euphorbia peplus]
MKDELTQNKYLSYHSQNQTNTLKNQRSSKHGFSDTIKTRARHSPWLFEKPVLIAFGVKPLLPLPRTIRKWKYTPKRLKS